MGIHNPSQVSDLKADNTINKIHRKYNTGLRRFLDRQLDSKEDVDDVLQLTYLRLIQHEKNHELNPSWALLRKIASNILVDWHRSRQSRAMDAHVQLEEVRMSSKMASPEEVLKSREGIDMFNKLIGSLDEECRKAFVLNRFRGLPYGEIAREIGVSKSTVSRHISYVLFQLGKIFEKCILKNTWKTTIKRMKRL